MSGQKFRMIQSGSKPGFRYSTPILIIFEGEAIDLLSVSRSCSRNVIVVKTYDLKS